MYDFVMCRRECVQQWVAGEDESVRDLPFQELAAATGGFHISAQLGGGGSCFVYRGVLFGLPVAVKHLSRLPRPGATDQDGEEWGQRQFTAEMELLCRVSHACICRLFAFSTDGPQRCLVLELCTGGVAGQAAGVQGRQAPAAAVAAPPAHRP